ncbi:MAG: MarR family winged helix-turn-helix transcriptional regulator [Candidatus Cryptobacteroides sp.]|jgi:DNA-binding MarR family transcriptional regulator|nr:MarR family transcriptional regulator [Rikenellaceae bacterium]
MVLSKQLGVFLNFVHNRFKLWVNESLQKSGYNITAEQFLLLDTLWMEGPLSQQKIADIMLKDKNSVVKLVNSLEARGLVTREVNQNDRRENIVTVTKRGIEIQEPVTQAALNAVEQITSGLSDEEISTFIKALDTMAGNMDKDINLLFLAEIYPTKR